MQLERVTLPHPFDIDRMHYRPTLELVATENLNVLVIHIKEKRNVSGVLGFSGFHVLEYGKITPLRLHRSDE
jgi:hypothetical protein